MKTWLLMILVLVGCSGVVEPGDGEDPKGWGQIGEPKYSDEIDHEAVGEQQQALSTCTKPTGGGGDPTAPFVSYVTGIHVHDTGLKDYQLEIESTNVATGAVTVAIVDFGGSGPVAQAAFNGPGWSGSRLKSVTKQDAGCNASYPFAKCIKLTDGIPGGSVGWIYADTRYAAPWSSGTIAQGVTMWMGEGVTQVLGNGHYTAQSIRWRYDNGTGSGYGQFIEQWEGAALDACAIP